MNQKTLFSKNMKVLQEKYPALASRVMKAEKDSSYRVIRSKNRYPNVILSKNRDRILFYDNDDPIKSCREHFEELNINYAPMVIFFGLGLGYHLDVFLKEYGKKLKTDKIIIFEEDIKLFRIALELGDFRKILSNQNIYFYIGNEPKDTRNRLQEIFTEKDIRIKLRSMKIIALPASINSKETFYQSAMQVVKKAAQQVMILSGNDSFDSIIGLEHILKNIKHIASNPGIKFLYEKFRSKPCIVVAAGPSLKKNIQMLENLREKALIIACDASLKPMMKYGIRPHLVTSLERTPGTEKFFDDIKDFEGIYHAVCPVVVPAAFETFQGTKIITYRPFSHFDWLGIEKGFVETGISVANMAFKIAQELGCDPIILVGQDLAFGDDGSTHAKGAVYGERDEWYHKSGVHEVEGNNGRPVKTTKVWDAFRFIYEKELEKYEGTCVDATEGGARIKGATLMSLRDAITKYCNEEFFPQKIIQKAIFPFLDGLDVRSHLKQVLKKVKETRKGLNEAIQGFKELINEINTVEEENIKEYLLNGKTPDTKRIEALVAHFPVLTSTLLDGNKAVQGIMCHTLLAYDTWASNEFYFLRDIYTDKNCLSIAQMLKIRKWLKDVAQYIVCTRDIVEEAEERLNAELSSAV